MTCRPVIIRKDQKPYRNWNLKILLVTIASLALLVVAAFFILGYMSQSGEASGLVDGRLAQCPGTPNCVCSELEPDTAHYIDPLVVSAGDAAQIRGSLKTVIRDMGGSIQVERDDYLAATFTSSIFGFVDDLEVRIDAGKRIVHLRSASRVGRGDLDANRKRVEHLKSLFRSNAG